MTQHLYHKPYEPSTLQRNLDFSHPFQEILQINLMEYRCIQQVSVEVLL